MAPRQTVLVVDPKATQPPLSVGPGWFGREIEVVVPGRFDGADLDAQLAGATAIVTVHRPVTAQMMDQAPGLRVIAKPGVGTDNIDLAAAAARGVIVTNVPGTSTRAVAEHALHLLLALARRQWAEGAEARSPLELEGRTLGVLGFGQVGAALAGMAAGIGMQVVVCTRSRPTGAYPRLGLDDVLARADAVALCLPLSPDTRAIIDERRLGSMRPDALLVNVGRGPLVHTPALVSALRAGHLGGVALDVTDPEPLPPDHPLRGIDRVILTPHVAGYSDRANAEAARRLRANVVGVLLEGVPVDPVTETDLEPT